MGIMDGFKFFLGKVFAELFIFFALFFFSLIVFVILAKLSKKN